MTQSLALQPNSELIPGYRLSRRLGRGGAGEVWQVEAPGGIAKALKIMPMEEGNPLAEREFEGLKTIRAIRHPFLLAIDRFELVDGFLLMVMELADKSLSDRMAECTARGLCGIPRDELLLYMREASEVLDLLNREHGLQHLDIKPTNLLLCGKHIKVADFGLVQPRGARLSDHAMAFSPQYAPPELFGGDIETTADQYSLAVTYQELLTGTRPYSGESMMELFYAHNSLEPDLSALSEDDRKVLACALSKVALRRFGNCTKLVDALHDPSLAPDLEASKSAGNPRAISRTPTPGGNKVEGPRRFHGRAQLQRTRKAESSSKIAGRTTAKGDTDTAANKRDPDKVRNTFLANIPLPLFILKLRTFVQDLDAEVLSASEETTELRFRARGRFGFRSSKAIFVRLQTFSPKAETDRRAVDVTIWSNMNLPSHDLSDRATLIIRALRGYLMASDEGGQTAVQPELFKQALWQK